MRSVAPSVNALQRHHERPGLSQGIKQPEHAEHARHADDGEQGRAYARPLMARFIPHAGPRFMAGVIIIFCIHEPAPRNVDVCRFCGRFPVFVPSAGNTERFWGIISAVVDVQRLYKASGLFDDDLGIDIALIGKNALGPLTRIPKG